MDLEGLTLKVQRYEMSNASASFISSQLTTDTWTSWNKEETHPSLPVGGNYKEFFHIDLRSLWEGNAKSSFT